MHANAPTAQGARSDRRALRVCFAGGGSGGHLYPCVALAQHLRQAQPTAQLLFLGARRGPDRHILQHYDLPHELLSACPVPYRISPQVAAAVLSLPAGLIQAASALGDFAPDVLFTTGGYLASSVLPAAWVLNVPIVLHDSDALTGRANRLLARLATRVTVTFDSAQQRLAAYDPLLTGQPVRSAVRNARRQQAASALGVCPHAPTLLVTGGSQGARSLNRALLGALDQLLNLPDVQILHVCGGSQYERVQAELRRRGLEAAPSYHLWPYLHDMPLALACADLALSRAGSNTVAEIAARGLPAIIVPYPYAAAHQEANAQPLLEAGAAVLVRDQDLTPDALLQHVRGILLNQEKRRTMAAAARSVDRPEAVPSIAQALLQVANQ